MICSSRDVKRKPCEKQHERLSVSPVVAPGGFFLLFMCANVRSHCTKTTYATECIETRPCRSCRRLVGCLPSPPLPDGFAPSPTSHLPPTLAAPRIRPSILWINQSLSYVLFVLNSTLIHCSLHFFGFTHNNIHFTYSTN